MAHRHLVQSLTSFAFSILTYRQFTEISHVGRKIVIFGDGHFEQLLYIEAYFKKFEVFSLKLQSYGSCVIVNPMFSFSKTPNPYIDAEHSIHTHITRVDILMANFVR